MAVVKVRLTRNTYRYKDTGSKASKSASSPRRSSGSGRSSTRRTK